MGTVIHRATNVTCYDKELTAKAHEVAVGIFPGLVTEIIVSPTNGYRSFMIATCGSKERWAEAILDAENRQAFRDWIDSQAYEDGSNSYEIANVEYGSDANA